MAFRIRWTESAASDFESIARKIESEADFTQSCQTVRKIHESVEGLRVHPYIGEALQGYSELRRRLVEGFRIVYQVFEKDEVVEITRILHQKQDLSPHLEF